jgi:hypothetical protein
VYDGGSNATMFFAGLVARAGALRAEVVAPGFPAAGPFSRDGTVLAAADVMTGGAPWAPAPNVFVTLSRRSGGWGVTIASGSAAAASAVALSVTDAQLPDAPWGGWADWWLGASAGGFGGDPLAAPPGGATMTARLVSWTFAYAAGPAPPATLAGRADICVGAAGVVPVVVSVPNSDASVYLTGLSGTAPYMVTVYNVVGGARGAPSVPLRGLWFYARHMPPRAAALGFWADSRVFSGLKGFAAGAQIPAEWPDSSGRGHALRQNTLNQRPTFGDATAVYNTPSPWSQHRVSFRRGVPTNLVGGTDVLDLGIAGDFTAYVLYVGRSTNIGVLMGRGGDQANGVMDPQQTTAGWSANIFTTTNVPQNSYPGWLGFKIR